MATTSIANNAGASILGGTIGSGGWTTAQQASNPAYPYENNRIHNFTVEQVDNGYILRNGKRTKVCKDINELRDFFVAILVEQQLDK